MATWERVAISCNAGVAVKSKSALNLIVMRNSMIYGKVKGIDPLD